MKVICFHQSADLYGSDRSFFQVVEYLVKKNAVTVVLPRRGPLSEKLADLGVHIMYMDLSLLSRTYVRKLQIGKIFFPLLKWKQKVQLMNGFDVVYINTSVILDFYLMAPFVRAKKILHIREIPSKWLANMLSRLIKLNDILVVFNSYSTKASFLPFKKSIVVHNAFEGFEESKISPLSISNDPLKLLLIGRINSWKGQDFALSSLSLISGDNFLLRIVGNTSAGNEDVLEALKTSVISLNLQDKVIFDDFIEDTSTVYSWCDVVVVPSKRPEPFGRIAIEAMSAGKPVIAANHGGLKEIVNDESGILFEPNNDLSFVRAVSKYINDRELLISHSFNSKKNYQEKFSIPSFHAKLDKVFTFVKS